MITNGDAASVPEVPWLPEALQRANPELLSQIKPHQILLSLLNGATSVVVVAALAHAPLAVEEPVAHVSDAPPPQVGAAPPDPGFGVLFVLQIRR